MISIAVCEDSIPMQGQIETLIFKFMPECTVDVFSRGEELLKELSDDTSRYSIYMMDISLPGISGIETAASIRKRDPYALLIYITDYKEYVYQVFETLPFRFITKPIDPFLFEKALADALDHLQNRWKLFHFHIERKQYQIPLQEIVYFESRLRLVTLNTPDASYEFYGRLSDVLSALDELLFVRVHASYIINMDYIHTLTDTSILLRTGQQIPVSKRYRKKLRAKHLTYLKWRADQ